MEKGRQKEIRKEHKDEGKKRELNNRKRKKKKEERREYMEERIKSS